MIIKNKPSGFTLVELLVSLTIFMTASLIIIDTFVLS
ncbi:type II secretion system protein, partial [Candidatus Uhrbacteria bacterium]|nr:type II secretion system protein [Candidatus Uhrbacteria bacterium]